MMKPETNTSEDTANSVFPIDVTIRGIQSISYMFDPETVKPWSNEVVTHGEIKRNITFKETPLVEYPVSNTQDIPDVQLFKKLIELYRQLIEDFDYAYKSWGFDKPLEFQLQRYALIIYLAKCWEDWCFQMHAMFNKKNREDIDAYLKDTYIRYVIPYYRDALGCLNILGRELPPEMTNEQKKAWGIMMLYAMNKYFTVLELYDKDEVKSNKRLYKNEVEKQLFNNGLGYLIPDYKPEIPDNRSFLETAQSLLWSSWQKMYGAVCGVEQPRYEQIATHQEQDVETRQVPETKSMSRDEVVTDEADAPGLKKRHINSPNKNL